MVYVDVSAWVELGSLDENGPYRLMYFNIWFSAGLTIRERLEGMVLLEEVCHWERTLRLLKLMPFPVNSLCLLLVDKDVRSQLLLQHRACLLPPCSLP